MEPSIEAKVDELTIEQKLEAIKEINKHKDEVDRMIAAITNLIEYKDIGGIHPDYKIAFLLGGEGDEFRIPELIPRFYEMIDSHLKKRREELMAHARELMSHKSSTF